MARIPRMLITGEPTVYHVMSRTALDGFPMGDAEKDHLVRLFKEKGSLYFTEIIGYACLGNHFHILVRMLPDTEFTDAQIKERFENYHGKEREFFEGHIPFLRRKLSSLSEFVKEIKLGFSIFYNKRHQRRGFFWGGRFKSLIVENGDTLVNCLAYIDLNPVRAGLVKRPEDYRWNSIGYHVQTGNRDGFLSLDFGQADFGIKDARERLRRYRKYLYETGAIESGNGAKIEEKIAARAGQKDYKLTRADRFKYRTRYFTDSGIIGSREFVSENYRRFKHYFQSRNEKKPKPIQGLDGIYSLKRLIE